MSFSSRLLLQAKMYPASIFCLDRQGIIEGVGVTYLLSLLPP